MLENLGSIRRTAPVPMAPRRPGAPKGPIRAAASPFFLALAFLSGDGTAVAAEALPDAAAAKAAERCQRTILKEGRRYLDARLEGLGACVLRVVTCEQGKPGDATCLTKATGKCAKDVARSDAAADRFAAKTAKQCAKLAPGDAFVRAGLGFDDLIDACAATGVGIADTPRAMACIARQHRCAAERLLTLQYPRAKTALLAAGVALDADTCVGSAPPPPSGPPSGKAFAGCVKALAAGGRSVAGRRLDGLQKCLGVATACVQRKGSDAGCLARAASRCAGSVAATAKATEKATRKIEKKCGRFDFGTLADALGLGGISDDCSGIGAEPISLDGYGACLAQRHRCAAEELALYETPRAGELLREMGAALDATCARDFQALPGRDQIIVLGETAVLNAGARGNVGRVSFEWSIEGRPAGSALAIADPASPRQAIVPDALGDYVLSLVVRADGRTSTPASVVLTVAAQAPEPLPRVEVVDVSFTAALDGLVDPSSGIVLALEGPVDPGSLTADVVTLRHDDEPMSIDLAFDAAEGELTITPQAPLPLGGFFRLAVDGMMATAPAQVIPFETTFFTPLRPFGIVEGSVVTPERRPLARVTVRIAGQETVTGPDGRFHFDGVPEGPRRLEIDPSTVDDPIVVYTPLGFLLNVVTGIEPNTVGYPIVLTVVDPTTAIDFPADRILTSPIFPGLRVDFTGVTVRNPDGTIFAGPITVSPVGRRDVPMPFPGASESFWTIQPGGLLLDPPAKVTAPLPIPMDEGDEIDLWAFDHAAHQWVAYGRAVVDVGGATATSLPGEGLPFTGWHSVVTRREVTRAVGGVPGAPLLAPREVPTTTMPPVGSGLEGTVVDADGHALHGVMVNAGGPIVYTDYDGAAGNHPSFSRAIQGRYRVDQVLVGYNVFINGTFDRFEPRNVDVCATAVDILGEIFEECVVADVESIALEFIQDGSLPDVIEPDPIKMFDYAAVDEDGKLHLHKDLVNDELSHRIRHQLHGGLVGNSSRYRAEVDALSRKLASLGFRETDVPPGQTDAPFLDQIDIYTRRGPVRQAVRLFEAIKFHFASGNQFWKAKGEVTAKVLRGLNETDGVLWTRNDPFQFLNGYRPQVPTLRNRFHHAGIPTKLGLLSRVSTINSATRGIAGTRHGFSGMPDGHTAGREVDVAWIRTDGSPGNGIFYRALRATTPTGRTVQAVVSTTLRDVPFPADEYTEADQASFDEEEAFLVHGLTWRTIPDDDDGAGTPGYSRDLTQAYVTEIGGLRQRRGDEEIIFDDPGIVGRGGCVPNNFGPSPRCDVIRIKGHANHIHFGYGFRDGDEQPAGTDGAPSFPLAPPVPTDQPVDGFAVVAVEPLHASHAISPATDVVVGFSDPVDPSTLGGDAVRLYDWNSGVAVAVTTVMAPDGREIRVIPNAELPEGVTFALSLGAGVSSATGAPLASGGGVVTTFATGLSPRIVSARIAPESILLDRSDVSAASFAILGATEDGTERDVTGAVENAALTAESTRTIVPLGEQDDRLARVFLGRSTLTATTDSGLRAEALVDADLFAPPVGTAAVFGPGEPVRVRFAEAMTGPELELVEGVVVDGTNGVFEGELAVDPADDRVAVFVPDGALPRFEPLELEVTVRVTDPAGESVDVIAAVEFLVVGVQAGDTDTDGDGLPDVVEDALGDCVDAATPDTDGDGIADDLEDCDDDTLTNGVEANLGLNPGDRDTDHDGNLDPMELNLGCNPRAPETTIVVGRTVDEAAAGVAGVGVRALGRTATSNAAGTFAIPNVPACPERAFRVVARLDGAPLLEAVSASVTSVLGGMTDVGDVVMLPVTKPLYPPAQFTGAGADYVHLVDVNDDGVLDAVAVSNTLSVLLGRGDGTFEPEQQYVLGGVSPRSIDVGDLNTDGKVDLVTCVTGGLSLLLGNGDGTFADGQFIATSGNAKSVVAADMNGDMALDLVAASDGVGVVVLLGNGDGTFLPEQTFGNDRDQTDIAVGLFNDDAVPDVATSGRAFISSAIGEIVMLLGNGDGTLQAEQEFRTATDRVHALLAEDLDGDGELDLIAISPVPLSDGVSFGGSVLRGNGDGTFQPAENFLTGTDSASAGGRMALGQFTPDGNLDLVTANDFLDLSLVPGNGDGTFQAPISIPRGLVPTGVAVGDLNGDGLTDIVNTDTFDQQLWSLLGHANGTFEVAGQTRLEVLFESGSGAARRFATADFDGDGNLDLVAAGHRRRLSVALGQGDFFFQPHFGLEALPMDRFDRTTDVVAGNLDAGDTVDVVALAGQEVVAFLGNGDGTFGPAIPTSLGVGEPGVDAEELEAAHLNGDGNLDLVATLGFDDQVATLLGNGDGTFQPPLLLTGVDRPIGLAVADLENDGAVDVIVAPLEGVGLGIYRGNGDGTFAPVRFVGEHAYIQVAAADVNADTIIDLLASGYPLDGGLDHAAFVFLGNGDGTFQREQLYEADVCPEGLTSADLTGDDLPDFVTANCGANDLSLFVANGDGTFQPQVKIGVGQPDQLTAADLDGDGARDLIVGTEFVDVGILPHR